jgi:L-threonylcarbamoyladenylate synthase
VVDNTVHILRPGGVTAQQIQAALPAHVSVTIADSHTEAEATPRAPGMKYAHYAPKGKVTVIHSKTSELTASYITEQSKQSAERIGILTYEEHLPFFEPLLRSIDAPITIVTCGTYSEPATVAKNLYAALRQFDELGATRIYAEAYPSNDGGLGQAVMNRLLKAANDDIVYL